MTDFLLYYLGTLYLLSFFFFFFRGILGFIQFLFCCKMPALHPHLCSFHLHHSLLWPLLLILLILLCVFFCLWKFSFLPPFCFSLFVCPEREHVVSQATLTKAWPKHQLEIFVMFYFYHTWQDMGMMTWVFISESILLAANPSPRGMKCSHVLQ